jgi:ribosome-associated translation inhibitor RaiA
MQSPITLTFGHIERTGGLEADAREIGERLLRFNERITHCHLIIEGRPDAAKGSQYSVKIHLSVPSAQIHARSLHNGGHPSDVYAALREAFDDAKRQLQELQVDRIRPCLSGPARARAVEPPQRAVKPRR